MPLLLFGPGCLADGSLQQDLLADWPPVMRQEPGAGSAGAAASALLRQPASIMKQISTRGSALETRSARWR
ncbi:hypothetical protein [Azohydromonas australica]|uniref:hypothetical protein n=1 Tax=Azohydromonas australica TaxID=364039 RepID=UPI00042624DA|nr:hypothetical protein [Azohydromonas australica]